MMDGTGKSGQSRLICEDGVDYCLAGRQLPVSLRFVGSVSRIFDEDFQGNMSSAEAGSRNLFFVQFVLKFGLLIKCRKHFLQAHCFKIAACPGGETGRHIGLKIRRLPEKGRAGSIPAPGTKFLFSRF